MNRLNELIKKLCPNGVEFKSLESICPVMRGKRLTKDQLSETGKYIVYHGSKDTPLGYYNDYNVEGDTVIVVNTGGIGGVKYNKDNFWCSDGSFWIKHNERINNKFLYYYLVQFESYFLSQKRVGGVPTIDKSVVSNTRIPVPPLEVQDEIVHILDDFTLLSEELSAELKARQKQYEYYEDKLLNKNYKYVRLEDVCNISAGGTPTKTKNEYWDNGTIKWLGSTVCKNKKSIDEVTGYITELGLEKSSAKLMKEKTTLIAMVGATIGKVAFLNFEATTNQNVACLYPKNENELDPDYLYYACKNLYQEFVEFANGKFAMASLGFIKNLEIPLPNLEEQKKIVGILDRFNKMCNDISEGLPAEIEARQKQYEYYRDKLLTFKELVNEG